MAPGICPASQREWPTGENTSFTPCQSSTRPVMSAGSNPQGLQNAMASSIQPYAEVRSPSL
ncbi:hypothetical protein SMICM304S_08835 [Streptomyces microflavus]